MDWMVAPSFPAFAAVFPASTGMLTFSKNRMSHLLMFSAARFSQRYLTRRSPAVAALRLFKLTIPWRGRHRVQPLVSQPDRWYISTVTFTIELEREDDGRWLAEV